jgi:hypothetical protein
MSQLKAKQLKLAAEGDLLIGGTGGTGTVISATGKADQILRVVDGRPAWSINDNLKSENTFNTVKATDATGVVIDVENADGDDTITLASFKSGSASDEAFEFSSSEGSVTIAATGTATDVDLILAPKGGGDVVIGNSGGGVIQADDGEDLALFGGEGVGNLFLNGGGTGKIYYADDASDPNKEIATIGQLTEATAAATVTQERSEFAGNETFTLDAKTISGSIIVHLNGLVIKENLYIYNVGTKVITIDTGALGYTLDAVDQVIVTYEVTA